MVSLHSLYGVAQIVWLVAGMILLFLLVLTIVIGLAARRVSRTFAARQNAENRKAPGYLGPVLIFLFGLIGAFAIYALAANNYTDLNVAQTLVFVPLSFGLAAALIAATLVQSAQQAERRYWAERAWQPDENLRQPIAPELIETPQDILSTEPYPPSEEKLEASPSETDDTDAPAVAEQPEQQGAAPAFALAPQAHPATLADETWKRLQEATAQIAASASQLGQAAGQILAGTDRLSGAAEQIVAGTDRLSGAAEQVVAGTDRLSGAAEQVVAGTDRLSDVAEQMDSDFGRYSAELTASQSRLQEQQVLLANSLIEHHTGLQRLVEASAAVDANRRDAIAEQAAQASEQIRVSVEYLRQLNEQFGAAASEFTSMSEQYVKRTIEHFDSGLAEIVSRLSRTTSEIQDAVDGLPGAIRHVQTKAND